ncbi:hypothetical protein B0T19DRAFT_206804 [Cercophora scortea]|uniref:Uncharacterized protein n=1 Tax=Cercophora scortea TaxID=314031 RepID=A0AAE0M9J0_9PEZI|nr:hypothetical protein B0T19DRAFT_206804 [Cercophora scortea]
MLHPLRFRLQTGPRNLCRRSTSSSFSSSSHLTQLDHPCCRLQRAGTGGTPTVLTSTIPLDIAPLLSLLCIVLTLTSPLSSISFCVCHPQRRRPIIDGSPPLSSSLRIGPAVVLNTYLVLAVRGPGQPRPGQLLHSHSINHMSQSDMATRASRWSIGGERRGEVFDVRLRTYSGPCLLPSPIVSLSFSFFFFLFALFSDVTASSQAQTKIQLRVTHPQGIQNNIHKSPILGAFDIKGRTSLLPDQNKPNQSRLKHRSLSFATLPHTWLSSRVTLSACVCASSADTTFANHQLPLLPLSLILSLQLFPSTIF